MTIVALPDLSLHIGYEWRGVPRRESQAAVLVRESTYLLATIATPEQGKFASLPSLFMFKMKFMAAFRPALPHGSDELALALRRTKTW